MLPPLSANSVAHSTREGMRVKQKIVQAAQKTHTLRFIERFKTFKPFKSFKASLCFSIA